MSYLPCENPSCKSYGSPHPNCRCHGDMAEGGEAGFCTKARSHDKSCQYFSEGGESYPDFIPDDQVPPYEATPVKTETPDFIPDDQVPQDETPDFIPDDQVPNDSAGSDENSDLSPADLQAKIFDKYHPDGVGPYESTGQQISGMAEGLAQGVAPVISTLAETKLLGIPAEDIAGRQEANPWEHGAAEALGSAIGPGKAVKALKIGSKLINGAIVNGAVQAGDEVSKWILGQGDPSDGVGAALARTGLATFFGGLFGKTGESAEKGAAKLAESRLGERLEYFLYGLSSGAKGEGGALPEASGRLAGLSDSATTGYETGRKAYAAIGGKLLPASLGAVAQGYNKAREGYAEDGLEGGAIGGIKGMGEGALSGLVASLAGKGFSKISAKVVAPTLLKILSNGKIYSLTGAFDHAADMAAGSDLVTNATKGLLGLTGHGAQQVISSYGDKVNRQKIKDELDDGWLNRDIKAESQPAEAPGFARGGEVSAPTEKERSGLATHFPEQNIIMHAAKGRILGYLNGLRPEKTNLKLPFDAAPDMREKERSYNKAIDLADAPLGILEEIKRGTIEPEHVQHFNAMHPEVGGLLKKKLLEGITELQMNDKKPSFKVRQGLSMFMGTALSSDFTPASIQAAQAVFAQAAAQKRPNQSAKTEKNTSTLSKSDDAFLTSSQARVQRSQRA